MSAAGDRSDGTHGTDLEGFWGVLKGGSPFPHFFLAGDESSLCGRWRTREVELKRERPTQRLDCARCAEIWEELFKNPLPGETAGAAEWVVKTDHEDGNVHRLFYQGKEQSRARGPVGLKTLQDTAELANRSGTVPKKHARARCAADAKDPAKFIAKKAAHSPELPLHDESQAKETTEVQTPTPQPNIAMSATTATTDTTVPAAAAENTSRHAEFYNASDFIRYPENRVPDPADVEQMKFSLEDVGMIQPVTARRVPHPETGELTLQIVIGETRWLGALAIGPDYQMPAFVRDISDKEAAKLNAIENFQRKDLDLVQEAKAIQNMKVQGWTHEEIEKYLGVAKDNIYRRLTLLQLDEKAHTAIREGNLSLKTAVAIASIPEEKRAAALEAVVTPKYSTGALPQREALKLLEREYIEPIKQAEEWEGRRDAVLENFPGAKWNSYDDARALDRCANHYNAESHPYHSLLSDAARSNEVVVPTWGELAKRHGGELKIACGYDSEAYATVEIDPLIDAEKLACAENPASCIFVHEEAVQQARDDAERRREELVAQKQAMTAERVRAANLVLSADGVNKTNTKKLVECMVIQDSGLESGSMEIEDLARVFGIEDIEGEEPDQWVKRVEGAVEKYLRSKSFGPFEAMGRICIANWVLQEHWGMSADQGFETGLLKPADFPAFHKEYEVIQQRRAAEESAERERQAQAEADAAKEEEETGTRYTDAQKSEVVRFVRTYNEENGRGGQGAAAERYGVPQDLVSSWVKAAYQEGDAA